VDEQIQADSLNTIKRLNQNIWMSSATLRSATRINSFELAHRMQLSAPELMDVSKESKQTLKCTAPSRAKAILRMPVSSPAAGGTWRAFREIFHESWDQHGI